MISPDNSLKPFEALVGLALTRVSHADRMCIIHFGDLRPDTNHRGETVQLPEWALHLQCPWRFVRHGRVVLGSSDFDRNAETGEPLPGNRNDGSAFLLNRDTLHKWMVPRPVRIESVKDRNAGAFDLQFNRNLSLSVVPVFSHVPEIIEDWRLFQPGRHARHIVHPAKT